jgi:hypothetical protein
LPQAGGQLADRRTPALRFRLAGRLALTGLGAAALAMLLLVVTCTLPDTFKPEHFDQSINYIAAYPLAAPPPADADLALWPVGLPAAWDWGWRDPAATGNTYEYMSMSYAGLVGPNYAPAWRLELKNLFRNGTFTFGSDAEREAYLRDNFDPSHAETTYVQYDIRSIPSAAIVNDHGLYFNTQRIEEYLSFNMFRLLEDAPLADNGYYLRFLGEPSDSIQFLTIDPKSSAVISPSDVINASPVGTSGSFFIDQIFTDFNDGGKAWSLGGGDKIMNITIDELRVLRSDIMQGLRLRLRLRPLDTTPELVTGFYEFSLWIRRPDDAWAFDHPARKEHYDAPYAATRVTVALQNVKDNILYGGNSAEYAVGDDWTRIVLRLPPKSNIQRFDKDSTEAVLELSIVPAVLTGGKLDAGAVLIALPSLNYFIGGYPD